MRLPSSEKWVARAKRFARPLLTSTKNDRLRWAGCVLACAAMAISSFAWFYSNFAIAWDRQTLRCMDVRFLLVDKRDKTPERDAIVTYVSRNASPIIKDGTVVGKYLRGMPGDVVEIRPDESILINGVQVAKGLPHLFGISEEAKAKFFGRRVLGDNEYWVMGTTRMSFDSRYWGPIHRDQILGRAYALF